MKEHFSGIKLLILDDEYWARKTLIRLCGQIPGVNIVGEFESAEQALAFSREFHIDAAIIDILLPVGSGLESGKIMKEENPELNLIFMSAVDSYSSQIPEYSGDAFLRKPVILEELKQALGLAGWKQQKCIIKRFFCNFDKR